MEMKRSDLIGYTCAVLAIGTIAWLSTMSWKMADCRELDALFTFVGHTNCMDMSRAEIAEMIRLLETTSAD